MPVAALTSDPVPRRRARREGGVTLVEVTISLVVLSVGAFSALGTMLSSTSMDEELRERSIALRAALGRMESILAYDYENDIDNLVDHWSQPANATFSVDGLGQDDDAQLNGGQGVIAFDTTDPERISVTVTISWTGRKGARTLSLPMVVTEVVE